MNKLFTYQGHLSQYYLVADRQSAGTSLVDLAKNRIHHGKGPPKQTRMNNDRNIPSNRLSGSTGSVQTPIILLFLYFISYPMIKYETGWWFQPI